MATLSIRPMSVGELLDATLAIYRQHFGTLLGTAAVCVGLPAILAPTLLVPIVFADLMTESGNTFRGTTLLMIVTLLVGLGTLVATAAVIRVISEAYLGLQPTVGDALRFALARLVPLFVAGLAKTLVIFVGVAIPVLLSALLAVVLGPFAVLLFFLAIPVGIVLVLGYALVTQAVILESLPAPTAALGRSWNLTKGFKGKVFLLGFVVFVLLLIPQIVGAMVSFVPYVGAAASALIQLMVYPVLPCAFTLLYYDLRVRKEAFDLEYLARQMNVGSA